MNQQQIRQAITGISKLLVSNPELLAQQIAGLKTLLPGLNEAAITGLLEKTKTAGFNLRQMEEELGKIEEALNPTRETSH